MSYLSNKKVLCLMSGGVDSSVAALLLSKQGYDVTGVYLRNWEKDPTDSFDCDHAQESRDAAGVAKKLDISFEVWNFTKEYTELVISYFVDGYKRGITPNPDIRCNRFVKFGSALTKALSEGFDYIATGHYGKIDCQDKVCKLLTAKDTSKDQTYFLATLDQKQLKHILFPLADLTKKEVREIAKKQGLKVWNKKDSTGICFVGKVKLKDFLKKFVPQKFGNIVNEAGEVLGQHQGAWFYTIGQRHGLGVGGGEPFFVKKIDVKRNIVTVTTREQEEKIFKDNMTLTDINWLGRKRKLPLRCLIRIRHQGQMVEAVLNKKGEVKFKDKQRAIAPGQQAVFYSLKKIASRQEVLGGGIIK